MHAEGDEAGKYKYAKEILNVASRAIVVEENLRPVTILGYALCIAQHAQFAQLA
jgi:hypothetical protein